MTIPAISPPDVATPTVRESQWKIQDKNAQTKYPYLSLLSLILLSLWSVIHSKLTHLILRICDI